MTEIFEPCPFCGRTRHLSVEDAGGIECRVDGVLDKEIPTWQVYCGYCGACGPEVIDDKDEAVATWNRRGGERDADEWREVRHGKRV